MIYHDKRSNYFTSFRPSQKDIVNKVYGANFKKISIVNKLMDFPVLYLPSWGWSQGLLFVCYLILISGIMMGFLFPDPVVFAIVSGFLFIFIKKARIMDVLAHASVLGFVTALSTWQLGIVFLLIILIGRYGKDKHRQEEMERFKKANDVIEFIYTSAKSFPMKITATLVASSFAMKKMGIVFDAFLTAYLAGLDEAEGVEDINKEDVIEFLLPIFKGETDD